MMNDKNSNPLIIYQTEDGTVKIETHFALVPMLLRGNPYMQFSLGLHSHAGAWERVDHSAFITRTE